MDFYQKIAHFEKLLSLKMNGAYWRASGMRDHFQPEVDQRVGRLLQMSHPDHAPDFNPLLAELIAAAKTLHMIERLENDQPPLEDGAKISLEEIVRTARQLVGSRSNPEKKRLLEVLNAQVALCPVQAGIYEQVQAANQRVRWQAAEQGKQRAAILAIGFGLIGLLGLLAVLFLILVKNPPAGPIHDTFVNWKLAATYTPTPVPPTPQPTVAQPTLVPTKAPTVAPTIAPTATSMNLSLGLDKIYPPVPGGTTAVFVMDDPFAAFEPARDDKLWKTARTGLGNSHVYVEAVPDKVTPKVTWKVDRPIPEDGFYKLFALDPLEKANGQYSLPYQVLANNNPVAPVFGNGKVSQGGPATLAQIQAAVNAGKDIPGQRSDEWVALGLYSLKKGDMLSVVMTVPTATPDQPAGIDAILVTRLLKVEEKGVEAMQQLQGKNLLHILDDTDAERGPAFITRENWKDAAPNPGNWNGVKTISPDKLLGTTITATYTLPTLLSGKYELWTWVPSEAQAAEQVKLSLGLTPADAKLYTPDIEELDPVKQGLQAKLVKLGTLAIPDTALAAPLKVVISSAPKAAGVFAPDSLFIIFVAP